MADPIALARADDSWSWVIPPLFCLIMETEPCCWDISGL